MEKSEEPEVEMEDASEDTTLIDIDGADSKNPLKVADYVEEIYKAYRNIEVIFLIICKSSTAFTILGMCVIWVWYCSTGFVVSTRLLLCPCNVANLWYECQLYTNQVFLYCF
jgi:hypothetical protein